MRTTTVFDFTPVRSAILTFSRERATGHTGAGTASGREGIANRSRVSPYLDFDLGSSSSESNQNIQSVHRDVV